MPSGSSLEWETYLNDAPVTAGAQRGALDHSVTNADGSEVVLSPETESVRVQDRGSNSAPNGGLRGVLLLVLLTTI